MSDITISDDVKTLASNAGDLYRSAIALNREDFQFRALHYPLLRLSVHGVSAEDRQELSNLAVDVVEERDVTDAVDRLTGRASASPIAIAIAQIVGAAQGSKWLAMLGAVVGAHAGFRISSGDQADIGFDVVGAIVGATCMDSDKFLQQVIGNDVEAFVKRIV